MVTALATGSVAAFSLLLSSQEPSAHRFPASRDATLVTLEFLLGLLLWRVLAAPEGARPRLRSVLVSCVTILPAALLLSCVNGVDPWRAVAALALVSIVAGASSDLVAATDRGFGVAVRAALIGVMTLPPFLGYLGEEFLGGSARVELLSPFALLPRFLSGDVPPVPPALWLLIAGLARSLARARERGESGANGRIPALCVVLTVPLAFQGATRPAARTAFDDLAVPGAPVPASIDLPSGFRGEIVLERAGFRAVYGPTLGDRAQILLLPSRLPIWPPQLSLALVKDESRTARTRRGEDGSLELRLRPLASGSRLGLVVAGDAATAERFRERLASTQTPGDLHWVVPVLDALPENPLALSAAETVVLLPGAASALGEARVQALAAWLATGEDLVGVSDGPSLDDSISRLVDGGDLASGTARFGLGGVRSLSLDLAIAPSFRLDRVRPPVASTSDLIQAGTGQPPLPEGGRARGAWLYSYAATALALTALLGALLAFTGRRGSGRILLTAALFLPGVAVAGLVVGPLRNAPALASRSAIVELRAGSPRGRIEALLETTGVGAASVTVAHPDHAALFEWTEIPRTEDLEDHVSLAERMVRSGPFSLRPGESRLFRMLAPFDAAGTVEAVAERGGVTLVNRLREPLSACLVVADGQVVAEAGDIATGSTLHVAVPGPSVRPLREVSDGLLAGGRLTEAVLLRLAAATGRLRAGKRYLVGFAADSEMAPWVPQAMGSQRRASLWIVELPG